VISLILDCGYKRRYAPIIPETAPLEPKAGISGWLARKVWIRPARIPQLKYTKKDFVMPSLFSMLASSRSIEGNPANLLPGPRIPALKYEHYFEFK
jgi:hypothetical protein